MDRKPKPAKPRCGDAARRIDSSSLPARRAESQHTVRYRTVYSASGSRSEIPNLLLSPSSAVVHSPCRPSVGTVATLHAPGSSPSRRAFCLPPNAILHLSRRRLVGDGHRAWPVGNSWRPAGLFLLHPRNGLIHSPSPPPRGWWHIMWTRWGNREAPAGFSFPLGDRG